jgi:SAM-dependent methyltransferase
MGWFWPAVAAAMAADTVLLRRRVGTFDVLAASEHPLGPGYRLLTGEGVVVDEATARAAGAYATRHGLDALDLIPGDLPAERLLDLARLIDPGPFRTDPLATGRGAGQAMLLTEALAERAGIVAFDGRAIDEMVDLAARVKAYAPRSMGHAIAPGLRSAPDAPDASDGGRLAALQATIGPAATVVGLACDLALLVAAARSRSRWATAAAALRLVQPWTAVAGPAARPRDRLAAVPARLVSSARDLPEALLSWASTSDVEPRRTMYDDLLSEGVDRFFEPRRPDCPLCGSHDLAVRLETHDLMQCKPGTFTLEQCGRCDHIFQNPRLNAAGLDFYYRDFYDGAHEAQMGAALSRFRPFYAARAEMLRGVSTPRRWLDVGSGHGHFCLMARATWPATRFDGLDMSETIVEAERRGWVDRSFHGTFTEHADALAGQYDVVSMFHYLEHTPDPKAQLDAATTVLSPGGLLLIEVPDPESRLADVLGPFWPPWGQPQHLHFVTVDNLSALVRERGYEVVSVVRGPARIGMDFLGAVTEATNAVQPAVHVPWVPRPSPAAQAKRAAALTASAPALAAGLAIEMALWPLGGRFGTSNAYRLLARRTTPASSAPPSRSP